MACQHCKHYLRVREKYRCCYCGGAPHNRRVLGTRTKRISLTHLPMIAAPYRCKKEVPA